MIKTKKLFKTSTLIVMSFMFFYFPAIGQMKITDGDTIRYNGEKIRLAGIDAPESAQTCILNEKIWNCGLEATNALKGLIGNTTDKVLRCDGKTRDKYGRLIGICYLGKTNINQWMVENGWAFAYRYYLKTYLYEENRARQSKKGLWQAKFVYPWNWRKGKRLKNSQVKDICNIKGNITSKGDKIYHTTEGLYYLSTKINEQKGEKWFCSETEALAKGWRKSTR